MPHIDGCETLRTFLNIRQWSSSPYCKIIHNSGHENLNQFICIFKWKRKAEYLLSHHLHFKPFLEQGTGSLVEDLCFKLSNVGKLLLW